MNNEIEKAKTKKTKYQIKQAKVYEQARIRYAYYVDGRFSLGKYADPKSKDYKEYLTTIKNQPDEQI